MNSGKGLSAFLTGAASIDEVVHPSDIENLDLLTVGALPRNPAELLGSTHMPKLLQKVAGRYGRIVIDSPPVTGASDPLVLLPHIKGVIFVVGFSKTRREIVARTMHRLRECCAPLLGVVLNNINLGSHSRYYYPYRYSYYYRRPTEESDSRSPIVRERRLSEKTLT
jgi:capsular exopolysaccharide synthesis family protein